MNWEFATFALTVIVLLAQLYNSYVITGLKYWTQKNFVSKDDMSTYLAPLKDSVQMLYSQGRVSREH